MIAKSVRRSDGFTLIEVLVSVVILSIGLLGIAGLQANSLRNNHGAFVKTQAANLAADMADRIRANPDENYIFDTENAPADPGCITTAEGCDTAQLAQYDQFQWSEQFTRDTKQILPGGQGFVTSPAPSQFTVTVAWQDVGNNGLNRATCNAIDDQGNDQVCFSLSFGL